MDLNKKVIDDCDYYILVIAGRYGSLGPGGLSYTEMEYRYALEKDKPIIAFLHKNPDDISAGKTEDNKEGREKLQKFKEFSQQKLIKYWATPMELGSIVSRSIVQLIKTNPAVVWIRADAVSDDGVAKEILKLKNPIEDLKNELKQVKSVAPEGSEKFAQESDEFNIDFTFIEKKGIHQYIHINQISGLIG